MLKESPYHNGRFVKPEEKKKNTFFAAKIENSIEVNSSVTKISVGSDFTPGFKTQFADQPSMQDLFKQILKAYPLENRKNLPVLIYYPANRSDLKIDVAIESEKDLSNKYEVYKDNLDSVIHYNDFFRWFRDREYRENAELVKKYKQHKNDSSYEDKELMAVRNSTKALLPDFSEMTVNRKELTVSINKNDMVLNFSTLSDGEKGIITLFADIARRLAIANENLDNPLEGDGIILIDEIEMHLHPSWQRKVCRALKETFPNCQFIITTHSPQVLGELQPNEIRILDNFNVYKPDSSFGLTSNDILDEVMDVNGDDKILSRNSEIASKLSELSRLVETEKFEDAKRLINHIEAQTGEIHETRKYKTALDVLEDENATN